jgi:hypothetical protein
MNGRPPNLPIYWSRRTNACALLQEDEFARLVEAAETYISAQAVLMSFLATLGNAVHRGLTRIPQGWQNAITKTVRESLDVAQRLSISQMQNYPGHPSSEKLFAAMAVATGVAGGAFGLPAILAELPITTGLILRSIADVGRSHGGRLDDPHFAATRVRSAIGEAKQVPMAPFQILPSWLRHFLQVLILLGVFAIIQNLFLLLH